MKGPGALDTIETLAAHAERRGVTVSARQIEEWNKDGLLPPPIRMRIPGQGRGRPKYQYPPPARDAVVWLGTYRRYIGGAVATKVWMWLEGFDFIQVDINAVVRERVEWVWHAVQQRLPSLPAIDELSRLSGEDRERLLDEIDENVTQPHLASGAPVDDAHRIGIGAAFLGILESEHLAEQPHNALVRDAHDKPYADYLLKEDEEAYAAPLRTLLPRFAKVANLVEVYHLVSRGGPGRDNWRAFWRAQKKAAPQQDLMRAWKYDLLTVAMMYLEYQRIILPPMLFFVGEGMRRVLEASEERDLALPPRLRAKLERYVRALDTPEMQAFIADSLRDEDEGIDTLA